MKMILALVLALAAGLVMFARADERVVCGPDGCYLMQVAATGPAKADAKPMPVGAGPTVVYLGASYEGATFHRQPLRTLLRRLVSAPFRLAFRLRWR